MMIDNSWILVIRTDFLTNFFKYFPILAQDYFYITILAFWYWLRPYSITSRSLAFLVALSTLINCFFKNLFIIPRPDISLHLIDVENSYGFPSGDAQVAVVFWGLLLLNYKNKLFNTIALIIILGIGFSRVYLGVHSIYDVIGGILIGSITLCFWKKYFEKSLNFEGSISKSSKLNIDYDSNHYFKLLPKYFWIILLSVIFLFWIVSYNTKITPVAIIAIGALLGFGLSDLLNRMIGFTTYKMNVMQAVISFLPILIFVIKLPVIKDGGTSTFITILLKYMFITIYMFSFAPYIQSIVWSHNVSRETS